MLRDVARILIDRERIARRVEQLGTRIAEDIRADLERHGHLDEHGEAADRVILIPILTGSIVFVADLIRHMPLKLSLELVAVSSYPGKSMESKGVSLRGDIPQTLAGKHVLIIDDILDSGQTLLSVKRLVQEQNPASCRLCALLEKTGKKRVDVIADYVGFQIPDEFVVGYGLDYDGYYRNLPEIAVLRPQAV
jgi:hypoxanthine phosphoribosyltransferase